MPQPFKNAVMTRAGALLLTRAQAGEIKMEFTRIAVGDGQYLEDEKTFSALQDMTGLKALKNSYGLSSIEVYSEHSVKITALITNQDPAGGGCLIHEGYFINEMGLFAKVKDGGEDTEVLYSIAVINGDCGDFMPPFNGFSAAQIMQEYYATVSNSAEVTIQTGGAFVLRQDFDLLKKHVGKKIEELEKKIEELEARPKIWQGTAAEHAEAFEKGEVRVGDFVIISNDPDGGTAGGDDGEGTDTEPGAGTGDAGAGAVQDGGMPDTEPDDGQQSLREDVEK